MKRRMNSRILAIYIIETWALRRDMAFLYNSVDNSEKQPAGNGPSDYSPCQTIEVSKVLN